MRGMHLALSLGCSSACMLAAQHIVVCWQYINTAIIQQRWWLAVDRKAYLPICVRSVW